MPRGEFYVNVDAILEGADAIGMSFERASSIISNQLFEITKTEIMSVFEEAVVEADEDEGFPIEFQQHVLDVASRVIPTVFVDSGMIFVGLNLEDQMGNEEQLRRAYHQGAVLADKTKLDGPYEGQALNQDDEELRHEFWEAIRFGVSEISTFNKKTGKMQRQRIKDPEEKWEHTKRKYIEIWGEYAPEWLFMQYGQPDWSPTVPAIDIERRIQQNIEGAAETYLADFFYYSIEQANAYRSRGIEIGFVKSNNAKPNLRNKATGQFTARL